MHNKRTETKQHFKTLVTEEVLHRRTGDGHFLQVFIQCPSICIYLHAVKQPADSISEKVWTEPKPVSDFLLASQGWLWMQLKREKKHFWHCRERRDGAEEKKTQSATKKQEINQEYCIVKVIGLIFSYVQKKFLWSDGCRCRASEFTHMFKKYRSFIKIVKGCMFIVHNNCTY